MVPVVALFCSGFVVPTPQAIHGGGRATMPRMVDMDTIVGVGIALAGVGGGVGLIAFTENAGKRNEEAANAQPCVVCSGRQVVDCPICKGEGSDPFAKLVAGVQEMSGEEGAATQKGSTVVMDDWEAGEIQVEMFKDILSAYPVKVTGESACINCDGRGVIVCDNCQGTGLQPRFLERYSPDDFMD